MNKIFLNNVGDLAEAQRASFYHFLSTGITEELTNFPNPFIAKIRVAGRRKKVPCLVYLYTNNIKLKGPNYNLTTCLKLDLSYTIQLYIAGEYSYPMDERKSPRKINVNEFSEVTTTGIKTSLNRIRIKQDIFFGELPLMTEEGTFVISGCERVVISQIIRSPGIYFRKEFGTGRKTNYTATIISNKGPWTKVILDDKEKVLFDEKTEKFVKKKNQNTMKKMMIFLSVFIFN